VLLAGLPPGKLQLRLLTHWVEVLIKVILPPGHSGVCRAAKLATGTALDTVTTPVTVRLDVPAALVTVRVAL
jgi:hypothetical protein